MDSATLVQILLGLFGVSGVFGAVIALMKLRPEANSMAVTQMEASNKQLEEERDYWRSETFALRIYMHRLEAKLRQNAIDFSDIEDGSSGGASG